MMARYAQSLAWYERAKRVIPGASQTASKAPGHVGPIGAFPLALSHGQGCHVWDVDGHEYIDWYLGNTALTLGHNALAIRERIARRQMTLPSLPSLLEVEVAEQLCRVIPCAESVRFVKTGSEACAAAVRIARIATGRTTVLIADNGYHGWHDWYTATKWQHPGVPECMTRGVRLFQYNDLVDLGRRILPVRNTAPGDGLVCDCDLDHVALVMLEPTLIDAPAAGFLQGVIDLARAYGALVCFDEMICGGRWALGGAQAHFGAIPDLATFGKALGGGVPLAFVCGRRDLMRHAWPISGTFGGDCLGLAACQAVLEVYDREPVIERIWAVGQQMMDSLRGMIERLKVQLTVVGQPPHPVLRWTHPQAALCMDLLQQELALRGVLMYPGGLNPSYAHDAEAVDETLAAFRGALQQIGRWFTTNRPLSEYLQGEPTIGGAVRLAP